MVFTVHYKYKEIGHYEVEIRAKSVEDAKTIFYNKYANCTIITVIKKDDKNYR